MMSGTGKRSLVIRYLNIFIAVIFGVIYLLGRIPPSEKYNLWIVNFMIPIALFFNILLIFVSMAMRRRSGLLYVLSLLIGFNYLISSVGLKFFIKPEKVLSGKTFSVLNYNVGFFSNNLIGNGSKIIDQPDSGLDSLWNWMLNVNADIQCYQEFTYNPPFNNIDLLGAFQKRGYYYYFSGGERESGGSGLGILIISRFQIIAQGDVMVSENGYNRIAFADVKLKEDTIRIINVHLESMAMKGFHPGYSENFEDQTRNIRVVLSKLKSGVFERSKQIRQLLKFIKISPYPVVCAGDFNELPYSYSYQMLKKRLHNSFEESGSGFGFTYNGNTLSMLRIDNQFYSAPLKSVAFQTLDSVRYTDHFPLEGTYLLP